LVDDGLGRKQDSAVDSNQSSPGRLSAKGPVMALIGLLLTIILISFEE
jgi:hypothetical protein